MIDSKTRNDILLEEKIAQIDDINFDKIYDVNEFTTKQLEDIELNNNTSDYELNNDFDFVQEENSQPLFECVVQPNEFLDNYDWNSSMEETASEPEEVKQEKFKITNRPLFYTFTSIAVLLCILFIYNVFVINSLESSVNSKVAKINANNASYSVSVQEENNYITFENSNKLEIKDFLSQSPKTNKGEDLQTTNWFDAVCNGINSLFGGNY